MNHGTAVVRMVARDKAYHVVPLEELIGERGDLLGWSTGRQLLAPRADDVPARERRVVLSQSGGSEQPEGAAPMLVAGRLPILDAAGDLLDGVRHNSERLRTLPPGCMQRLGAHAVLLRA
ncbi:MAG TPA: hypothetical protein VFZ70_12335, partial [Euzebyales bacterium]